MDGFIGGEMLYKVYSNNSSFKPIEMKPGLNIILAERSEYSGDKASRNALGKTTFIEIIDFCLGSELRKSSKLFSPELKDWSFSLDIEVSGYRMEVTRQMSQPQRIYIHPMSKNIPLDLKEQKEDKDTYVELDTWRTFLGENLFNLRKPTEKIAYHPTARSILAFFIRKSGGYSDTFATFKNEKAIQKQSNNAFVLNLHWEKCLELFGLQTEIEKYNKIVSFYKAQGDTPGKLTSQIVTLTDEVNKLATNLKGYNVLPEYNDLQVQANLLTKELHDLTNKNIFQQKKLDEYMKVTQSEDVTLDKNIEDLYKEVQIVFPQQVSKTLKDVVSFHENIIKNRKEFLQSEINYLKGMIKNNNERIKRISEERADKMKILDSHGALDEYNKLQEELIKKTAILEKIKSNHKEQDEAKKKLHGLKDKKANIKYDIENDIPINENLKEEIAIFNKNSVFLYDKSANLVVDVDKNGNYKYTIVRDIKSEGIERMDIFCYDLMLVEMFRKNVPNGLDFVFHDSTLYDAVDSRQKAKAIELAAQKSLDHNFQYVFTINSDQLPKDDFSEDFNYNDFVVKRLSDSSIIDSLLGVQFTSPIDEEEGDDDSI